MNENFQERMKGKENGVSTEKTSLKFKNLMNKGNVDRALSKTLQMF